LSQTVCNADICFKPQELEAAAGSARNEIPSPFASAMMSMFANMVVDNTSTSSGLIGTRSTELRPFEELRNNQDNGASSAMQRSLIIPPDTDVSVVSDVDHAAAAAAHTVFQHSGTSGSSSCMKSTQLHCAACGRDWSVGLEQRLAQLISATEQRLTSRFTAELGRIETKMDSRFDEILRRLSGREAISCDLD